MYLAGAGVGVRYFNAGVRVWYFLCWCERWVLYGGVGVRYFDIVRARALASFRIDVH
jgi:hypothetical protein